ncbi:MAG: FecCD family ABC transporter permease [Clostridia bacterium]|jgi:iron complex transport system permease protein
MTTYHEKKRRYMGMAVALSILALLLLAVVCSVGSADIGVLNSLRTLFGWIPWFGEAIKGEGIPPSHEIILFQLRLPRSILAFFVGGALAISGACLQGLFKNPMADPHILGVSAGAGLGATIAIILGLQHSVVGIGAVTLLAFIGGTTAVFLVYSLARVRGRISTAGLLLAGTAASSLITALMSALMIMNRNKIEQVVLWTMGSFSTVGWKQVVWGVPFMLLGMVLTYFYAKDLNILLLGDEDARHLGVDIDRIKKILLAVTSLITAAAVSVSGVIGFVGLIVPHIVRLLVGPDHRFLMPFSLLIGGIFLMVVDTLARTVASPLEIPVGILTAVFGGPFFLYLLRKRGI